MFDFLSSDWFILGLEVVFLIFIIYDVKKYKETKKKEYLINIVLTLGFFIWTLIPFYNSYITWEDKDKVELIKSCEIDNNATLCACLDDSIFKEYQYQDFIKINLSKDKDYLEFEKETKEDCLDDSWF